MASYEHSGNGWIGEGVHFLSGADKQSLAEKLARDIGAILRESIAKRGAASLVVSGGSTPKPFFEALRQENGIDWKKVHVTLADDRWVDAPHPDSNEQLVKDNLLIDGMHFTSLKTRHATPHEGVAEVQARIAALPRPFDAVILGMGDDGHTASFFPTAPELDAALYPASAEVLVAAITPPEYAPHQRMTLTLPAILDAKRIILHITGGKKQEVYEKAADAGAIEDMPVRAVLRQEKTPVDIYWAA